MKPRTFFPGLLIVLIALALSVQPPAVQAAIVSTNQIATHSQPQTDRAKVQAFFERDEVKHHLQTLGVEDVLAKDRVASLNDQEIHALAQKIDSLPAGGNLKNLTDSDITVILLAAILLVLII